MRDLARLLVCFAIIFASPLAGAGPIGGGHILVTTRVIGGACCGGGSLMEFTPDGTLVQAVRIPNSLETDDTRDLIVDNDHLVHVYNGTFTPLLSTYDSASSRWTDHSFPGWSTVNNVTYGGIAIFKNFLYVSDMATFGAEDTGIIRFNLADYSAQRFPSTRFPFLDLIDLAMGLDGRLYSLMSDGQTVDIFDPITMASVGTIALTTAVRGIAVSQSGDVYGASLDGNLYHFDQAGTVVDMASTAFVGPFGTRLTDIDLSADGRLIAGTTDNVVIQGDTTLDNLSSFVADRSGNITVTFVAFTPSIPEPGTFLLVAGWLCAFWINRSQLRRRPRLG